MKIEESENSFNKIFLTIESKQELEDFISILKFFKETCFSSRRTYLAGNILEGLQEISK